jgi:hypothetical protein
MRSPHSITLAVLLVSAAPIPAQNPNSSPISDPASTLWRTITRGLLGAGGQGPHGKEFFEQYLESTLLPDPAEFDSIPGTLVSSKPVDGPTELILGFGSSTMPEIRLRLIGRDGKPASLTRAVAPGTKVGFAGVVQEFTREPFMLTFYVYLFNGGAGHLSILGPSSEGVK